jgi:hypothetical protein
MGGDQPAECAETDQAYANPRPRPWSSSVARAQISSSPRSLFRLFVIAGARKFVEFERAATRIATANQSAERKNGA